MLKEYNKLSKGGTHMPAIQRREQLAIIYARRSSERQNEESCPQQIGVCRELAERMGFTVVRVFADEAISGKTDRRPEFQKMIRFIESGKCDVVIAYKSNRIARNMLQALTYENRFEKAGVRIIYAKEEFGDNAAGRFALRNMMNLNQFYSENMSEDIKRCLYSYAQDCKVLTGGMPFGYRKGKDGRYAIDPDRAKIVKEIFYLYTAGVKTSAISSILNGRGIRTMQGNRFSIGAVERILKNEKYIGMTVAEIGEAQGKECGGLEEWRTAGMLTDDLSCCGVECAC
jgi:DNA invertase Pin-like site-specific DNA recombinase